MNIPAADVRTLPASSFFEPDILTSHQYFKVFRAQSHFSPEQRLMFAVLTDAVECFQKYLGAKSRGGRNLFHEAELWIASGDSSWPFSFERICEVFDMTPACLRCGLEQWRQTYASRKRPRKYRRAALRDHHRAKGNRLYASVRDNFPITV